MPQDDPKTTRPSYDDHVTQSRRERQALLSVIHALTEPYADVDRILREADFPVDER